MVKLCSFVRRSSVLVFVAGTASAQYNASVQGTVMDSSGSGVPNAKVTVTNQATQVATQMTTSSGGYTIGQLRGNYTVTVEEQGFEKSETKDMVVLGEQIRGLEKKL